MREQDRQKENLLEKDSWKKRGKQQDRKQLILTVAMAAAILIITLYAVFTYNTSLMIVLLLLFFCVLLIGYRLHNSQQTEIRKTLEEMQVTKLESEKQLAILQSMADIYYSMHLLDLDTNTAFVYEAKNQVMDVMEKSEDMPADVIMHRVMYATMSDSYLDIGMEFSEVTTLKERLKNKKFLSMDLLGRNVGWIRMLFITIEADEEGVPRKVICTTQVIDEEKKKEERLLMESNTDELTGCNNRRAYEDEIQKFPDIPPEEDFVYVAMDVNGLKVTNDSFGHDAGDELLLGAVKCMRQCLGNYGKIYRTGGDEFTAIIFANEQSLEAIRQDFEEVQLAWKGNLVDGVSVSTGYVSKREFPNATVVEMAKIADKRMYEHKAAYYHNKGVDRRGQAAAHTALCELYTKILKVNLSDDTYKIVNMVAEERASEKGFADSISGWLEGFGRSGQIASEDLEEYLEKTSLEYMREHFRGGKKSLCITYRRKYGDVFKRAVMEMIPADDYSEEAQNLFLYVKSYD